LKTFVTLLNDHSNKSLVPNPIDKTAAEDVAAVTIEEGVVVAEEAKDTMAEAGAAEDTKAAVENLGQNLSRLAGISSTKWPA
jgi:hypothetical protein